MTDDDQARALVRVLDAAIDGLDAYEWPEQSLMLPNRNYARRVVGTLNRIRVDLVFGHGLEDDNPEPEVSA